MPGPRRPRVPQSPSLPTLDPGPLWPVTPPRRPGWGVGLDPALSMPGAQSVNVTLPVIGLEELEARSCKYAQAMMAELDAFNQEFPWNEEQSQATFLAAGWREGEHYSGELNPTERQHLEKEFKQFFYSYMAAYWVIVP